MKILVLTSNKTSNVIAAKNKKDYCDKYNYSYINIIEESNEDYLNNFFIVKKYLKSFDFVFWMETDSIFFNNNIKLEDIIEPYLNYDIIIGEKKGCFFIKNSEFSDFFLDINIYKNIDMFKYFDNIKIVSNNIFNTDYYDLKNNNTSNKVVEIINDKNKLEETYDDGPSIILDAFVINFTNVEDKEKLIEIFTTMEIDYYERMRKFPDLYNDPLNKLIQKYINPTDTILEIGAYVGLSTKLFSEKVKHIDTVDKFMDVYFINKNITKRELFNHLMKDSTNYTLIEKDSKDLYGKLPDNYYDLIYLDGDHSYAGVKNDIINLLPKIKSGGYIAGHDYSEIWGGVIKAVDELLDSPDEIFDDSSWIKNIDNIKYIQLYQNNYKYDNK